MAARQLHRQPEQIGDHMRANGGPQAAGAPVKDPERDPEQGRGDRAMRPLIHVIQDPQQDRAADGETRTAARQQGREDAEQEEFFVEAVDDRDGDDRGDRKFSAPRRGGSARLKLAQAEKRQDRGDHHDQADNIDNLVHGRSILQHIG